jgi:DNA-binding transcriptional MerR regulator
MIRNLREMDMPLTTIRQVLAALEDAPELAEVLVQDYLDMREKQVEQLREQVQSFMFFLQKETSAMTYEMTIKTIPTQQVLSLTHHIKVDKLDRTIRQALDNFQALLNEQNASPSEAPFGFYHGPINMQTAPSKFASPFTGRSRPKGTSSSRNLREARPPVLRWSAANATSPKS